MNIEVIEALLAAVVAKRRLLRFDIAELSPPHDGDDMTARVAARLVYLTTTGLADADNHKGCG